MHRYARVSVHEFSGFEFSILNLTSIPFSSLVPSTLRPALRGFDFSILNLTSILFRVCYLAPSVQHSTHSTLRAAPRVQPACSTPLAAPRVQHPARRRDQHLTCSSFAYSTPYRAPRVQHPSCSRGTPWTAPYVTCVHDRTYSTSRTAPAWRRV